MKLIKKWVHKFKEQPNESKWIKVLRWFVAVLFLMLGVIGWLTPIMPGTLFFIIGLFLLGIDIEIEFWERIKLKHIHRKIKKHAKKYLRKWTKKNKRTES